MTEDLPSLRDLIPTMKRNTKITGIHLKMERIHSCQGPVQHLCSSHHVLLCTNITRKEVQMDRLGHHATGEIQNNILEPSSSDPDEDVHNDRKKGTADHDKLLRLKPLMDTIKNACKAFYHPHIHLAVDERMVASKAKTGITQSMKDKPTKWGFKLFVLADSRNGYTVDFSIYTGKSNIPSGHGLAYDVVMSLVRAGYLGTGYHVYTDNFHSSPKLFRALHACRFAACGTYREYCKECPRTHVNALTKRSERGSMRWIRDGPIVYVKWMDTREVSVCSTIHTAHSGKTVPRRVKQQDGSWTRAPVPCSTPVAEYNQHMGGVDRSDQLIQYYSAQHKTMRWYRTLFYHFLDVATTKQLHYSQGTVSGPANKTHDAQSFHGGADCCALWQASPHSSCPGTCGSCSCAYRRCPMCSGPQNEIHHGPQEV
ncbi:piggyBac transposable element-derived protein 4-like isoform 2-T2 [Lycodopsis pacificus]